jgi:hypothetical protein
MFLNNSTYVNPALAQGYYPSAMQALEEKELYEEIDSTYVNPALAQGYYPRDLQALEEDELYDEFTMIEHKTVRDEDLEDFYEISYKDLEESSQAIVVKEAEDEVKEAEDEKKDVANNSYFNWTCNGLCNMVLGGLVGVSTAATVAPIPTMNTIVAGAMFVAPGYTHVAATAGLILVNNAGTIGVVAKGLLTLNGCRNAIGGSATEQ